MVFPEFLQPSRGIFRALASVPRQASRIGVFMSLGSRVGILPFRRCLDCR